jgi:hypothetical protein
VIVSLTMASLEEGQMSTDGSELGESLSRHVEVVDPAMVEGYIVTGDDREALNRNWVAVDGEGWPD